MSHDFLIFYYINFHLAADAGGINSNKKSITLLWAIPRFDQSLDIIIISEIRTNMSQFGNTKRLYCWPELMPNNNESADKNKSAWITHTGECLQPALVQIAHIAMKLNKPSYHEIKYERIYSRRCKKEP